MRKNNKELKDLEDYLAKTEKSSNLKKLSNRLRVLINYYKGVSNNDNAKEYDISIRTIQRWVNKYETNDKYNIGSEYYEGRKAKINENEKLKIENDLMINPLKLGLNYSIWNGTLLRKYINDVFGIEVSKIYCEKVLNENNTVYKSKNYDAKKDKKLVKLTIDLINEYENKDEYSVWYFDTYYLGRNAIREAIQEEIDDIELMLRGNDNYTYEKHIVYGFFNGKDPFEYDIKRVINKENFMGILNEFVSDKQEELKNGIKLLIVLESNNVFKTIINKEKNYCSTGVKMLFLPKNSMQLNKINIVWDNLRKSNYSVKGKTSNEIEKEVKTLQDKIFW